MKILGSGAGAAWSRIFLPGAGATLLSLEPESAPGPRTSGAGAAQKYGGSATLFGKILPPGNFRAQIYIL